MLQVIGSKGQSSRTLWVQHAAKELFGLVNAIAFTGLNFTKLLSVVAF